MLLSHNGIVLLVWICVFTVVCAGVLGLRFWAAQITKRKLAVDDYLVVFAFINTLALEGTCIWAIYNGLGAHTNLLNMAELAVQFKLIVASGITWLLATVALKLSIVWLYTRIFSTTKFKRWAYAVMALVIAYGIAFLCMFMTNCQPISQQWDPVPGGWCRDISIEELASVTINLFIDLIIVIMPMPVLWGLQMAVRNKLFISMMFCIGFLTVGIMAWRIQVTLQASVQADFVFGFSTVALISFLELWLGLVVACMPTLAPLSNKYIKPHLSRLTSGRSKTSQDSHKLRPVVGGMSNYSNLRGTPHSGSEKGRSRSDTDEEYLVGTVTSQYANMHHGMNDPRGIWMKQDVQVEIDAHPQ